MRKDRSFSDVLVVCQGQTLLKPAFGVGADKVGHSCDDKLPDFSFSFRHFDFLWYNVDMMNSITFMEKPYPV